MTTDRSYDAALEVVKSVFGDRRDGADGGMEASLGEDVVEEMFAQAWRFQFDEGQGNFQREARNIVSNAVERALLGEDDDAAD